MGWNLVSGDDAGNWIAGQIAGSYNSYDCVAIALKCDDKFQAGVLYEEWNGKSIVTHIAIAGRMTPAFLAAIFDYPFNVCGAQKIIAPVSSDNARCIALVTNMGFRQEAKLQDASPTGDILLFTITKSNCRFLKERYGKKQTSTAARA